MTCAHLIGLYVHAGLPAASATLHWDPLVQLQHWMVQKVRLNAFMHGNGFIELPREITSTQIQTQNTSKPKHCCFKSIYL